jgi:hypothetical protein
MLSPDRYGCGTSHRKESNIVNFRTTSTDSSHFNSVYPGAAADSVRNHLSFVYGRAAGVEPSNWETRLYDNGLVVLAPVAGTSDLQKLFDQVNLGEAFCKAVGRAAEVLEHRDEEDQALAMLSSVMDKAEELAAIA